MYQLASKQADAKEERMSTMYNSNGDPIGDTVDKVLIMLVLTLSRPVAMNWNLEATPDLQNLARPEPSKREEKQSTPLLVMLFLALLPLLCGEIGHGKLMENTIWKKTGARSWNNNVKHILRAALKILICCLPVLSDLPFLICLPLHLSRLKSGSLLKLFCFLILSTESLLC